MRIRRNWLSLLGSGLVVSGMTGVAIHATMAEAEPDTEKSDTPSAAAPAAAEKKPRPVQPRFDRRNREPDGGGDFFVRHALQVAEDHDTLVDGLQLIQRLRQRFGAGDEPVTGDWNDDGVDDLVADEERQQPARGRQRIGEGDQAHGQQGNPETQPYRTGIEHPLEAPEHGRNQIDRQPPAPAVRPSS